ncbi:MAG: pilus assembly protein PilY, partial [Candidatus Desulfofervidus sp.]|nr:pilus assembly protein PilY [Candidatus Desulfofervidus sp.]
MAEFEVTSAGTWQFAIDSDDGSEVEIDGIVVANYYGAHGFCGCYGHSGSINLSTGWHRIIVRLRENTGDDGVIVWYKKPGDTTWTKFGSSTLNIRAPNIDEAWRLKSREFIVTGEPANCKRHLFCVTSTSEGDPHKIRVLLNKSNRIWEWASKENPVCDNSLGTPDAEYYVRVKVCDPSVGLETNCKQYPNGNYKPIGLLQKFGEGDGTKVCSVSYKSCDTDSDCEDGEGVCVDKAKIYFGLLTGSYTKNLSGGVLRKNIWSISDEINPQTGIFQSSENVEGNIIQTLDRLKTVGFRYSDHTYRGSYPCGWITTRALEEGECRMWGNPIAEMIYETLRYFAGKGSPTSEFTYRDSNDSGLQLSKPDWGIRKGGNTLQPPDLFPWCSKPSIVIISDINPSYDSDTVPGTAFGTYSSDDLSDLNVADLAKTIGDEEGISNADYFIGESNGRYDFICSPKEVSNLGKVRGLCPEEPTKQGSYYSAALAYYGHTKFKDNFSDPTKAENVTTYSVALSSPV